MVLIISYRINYQSLSLLSVRCLSDVIRIMLWVHECLACLHKQLTPKLATREYWGRGLDTINHVGEKLHYKIRVIQKKELSTVVLIYLLPSSPYWARRLGWVMSRPWCARWPTSVALKYDQISWTTCKTLQCKQYLYKSEVIEITEISDLRSLFFCVEHASTRV